MSGPKKIQIFLDSPESAYYGGQTVSGYVEVHLSEQTAISGILFKFRGEADVRWSESDSDDSSTTYSAHETYLSLEHYLIGGSAQEESLAEGNHTFPFQVVLPAGLPASFEGGYGNVRYTIKAKMQCLMKSDEKAKARITIVQHLDLNAEVQCKEPVHMSGEKFIGCFCCKSGPLRLSSSVSMTGYVRGQEIPLTTSVDNATNCDLDVVTYLTQVVTFHSTSKERKSDNKVCEVYTGLVGGHDSGVWHYTLQVPPTTPSFLRNCSIINIEYKIIVKAIFRGFHRSLEVKLPIIIGTIPLVSNVLFPEVGQTAIEPPSQLRP